MSKGTFVENVQRRQFDLSEYEAKAAEKRRLEEEQESLKDAKARNRARQASALVVRAPLQHRTKTIELESRLGKHTVITNSTPLSQQGGYYCDVCECLLKDSNTYLDHINGKKHQRALGMTLRSERSSLGEVKAKLDEHKRTAVEAHETRTSDLESRLQRFQESLEREADEKKSEKLAAKLKRKEVEAQMKVTEAQYELGQITSESRKRKQKSEKGDAEIEDAQEGDEDAEPSSKRNKSESASGAAASTTAAPEEEDPEAAMMRAMGFSTSFSTGKNK